MSEAPLGGEENVEREKRLHRHRNVAVVGLRNENGDLLLIRTARLPSRWQPIGGGMDPGDTTPVDTLVREVGEELGVQLDRQTLHPVLEAPYDFGEGTVYFYEAEFDDKGFAMVVDHNEIIDLRWVPIDEALNLPLFPATLTFVEQLARTS